MLPIRNSTDPSSNWSSVSTWRIHNKNVGEFMHQTDTLIDWIKKTKISSADYILTNFYEGPYGDMPSK
ncbi:Taste receptor type 2 member 8 [Manis javanica]|nr:Taste receptor type 2 member 8 [Manis javanica]